MKTPKLIATNSTQDMVLDIRKEDNEYRFTLYGDYKGEYMQVDFDAMTEKEFKLFINKCIRVLKDNKWMT